MTENDSSEVYQEEVEDSEPKSNGKHLGRGIGIVIALFLVSIGVWVFRSYRYSREEIHYHAGFKVYVDGQLQDFSDIKYMTIGFCGEDTHVDKQLEKAHLHDGVGDVVHVHRKGGNWGDLFKNISYSVDTEKPTKAYVNGQISENIYDYNIEPFDSVVILIGNSDSEGDYLAGQVSRERILEVEAKSESCGS